MSGIKHIETRYKGYRFRSRLEARYAVFFDALGEEWEFEKQGFDIDGKAYLPDFWFPKYQVWLEIKGERPESDGELIGFLNRFCCASKTFVKVAWGLPHFDSSGLLMNGLTFAFVVDDANPSGRVDMFRGWAQHSDVDSLRRALDWAKAARFEDRGLNPIGRILREGGFFPS